MKISKSIMKFFCSLVALQGLWMIELVAQNSMNAPIDLPSPRIKGGVTIWNGKIAYRDCHVQEA